MKRLFYRLIKLDKKSDSWISNTAILNTLISSSSISENRILSFYKNELRVILLLLLTVIAGQSRAVLSQVASQAKNQTEKLVDGHQLKKWVVVLDDPRPSRQKKWNRVGPYSTGDYKNDLALKRLSKAVLKDLPANLVTAWPIKSLKVHCLIVSVEDAKSNFLLTHLKNDKRVKWVQAYQEFELMQNLTATSNSQPSSTKTDTSRLDSSRFDSARLNSSKKAQGADQPSDPYYELQSNFKIDSVKSLTSQFDGQGVTIAMIDSGIDLDHKDLSGAAISQINLVSDAPNASMDEKHGTGIAGLLIANKGNDIGISGLAPKAKLYSYRSCWETLNAAAKCNSLTLALALDQVAELKPDILNLSLTGPKDRLLQSILEKVIANGTQVVAAFDPTRLLTDRFPTKQRGVIFAKTIAETNNDLSSSDDRQINGETNRENVYFMYAPGKKILTIQPHQTYDFMSGSSFATAHITAVLALMAQGSNNPALSINQMIFAYQSDHSKDSMIGTGLCDLIRRDLKEQNCFW